MQPSAIRPAPKIHTPQRIIRGAPSRSISQPSTGPMIAVSTDCSAAAPDSEVLLQPFSVESTAT
jgi:hypothetical protein